MIAAVPSSELLEIKSAAIKLYAETKLGSAAIADKLGVSRGAVDGWIARSGLPRHKPGRPETPIVIAPSFDQMLGLYLRTKAGSQEAAWLLQRLLGRSRPSRSGDEFLQRLLADADRGPEEDAGDD